MHTRVALAVGLLLGFGATLLMGARNSAGTYSLPSSVNPVVSGQTITSTWANTTLDDLASELTNSLDRQGRGAMLEPLQCDVGSVSAPGLTFDGDTDTGLYRIGANNVGMSAGGAKVMEWSGPTDGGVIAFGRGLGAGIEAYGGAGGAGVLAYGGWDGGIGTGVIAYGGTTGGRAGYFESLASATESLRAVATGATSAVVGSITGASADSNDRWALNAALGHVKLGGGNPTSTTAFTNTLTPMNVPKAWALITTGASTAVTAGFNIASVSCSNPTITVTMASAMSSTNYVVFPILALAGGYSVVATASSTTVFTLTAADEDGNALNLCGTTQKLHVVIFGAQ